MAEVLSYKRVKDAILALNVRNQTFAMWRFMRAARFGPNTAHGMNARRFFFLMISHAKTPLLKERALREFALICEKQDGPPSPLNNGAALKAGTPPQAS